MRWSGMDWRYLLPVWIYLSGSEPMVLAVPVNQQKKRETASKYCGEKMGSNRQNSVIGIQDCMRQGYRD
jgi:hypothetical protein